MAGRFSLKTTLAAAALLALPAGATLADETASLTVVTADGEIPITVRAPAPAHLEGFGEITSGWLYRESETQAMQADDFDNPALIDVDAGTELFATVMGSEGKSCISCHEGGVADVAEARATYPKWDEAKGEVQTLDMQVNECLTERMGAEALGINDAPAVQLNAAISAAARGMPVNVAIDGPAQSTWEKGKEIYYSRYGQLELACANCHEDNHGNMIRADHLSQGQINGFPAYRLKDAGLVTIHNRFRGCIRDTRAETFALGSPEFVALELYVASRGNGLSVEGPSVRN